MDMKSRLSSDRPEDRRAQEHVRRNWGTIEKLADTLSGGKYSANKAKKNAPPPQPDGLIIHDLARPRVADDPVPYLRISANGRVVLAARWITEGRMGAKVKPGPGAQPATRPN